MITILLISGFIFVLIVYAVILVWLEKHTKNHNTVEQKGSCFDDLVIF